MEALKVQRVNLSQLTLERINSLESAVKDFVTHYKEETSTFMGTWRWITGILSGTGLDQLWCAFDGEKVVAYFIVTPQQELNGDWYLFIHQAWGSPDRSAIDKRSFLAEICKEAFKWGCKSIKFLTRRNTEVFKEWLPDGWVHSRTLFELRSDHGKRR